MQSSVLHSRIFETAYCLWSARSPQMDVRRRLKRYTYGDQWCDLILNSDGRYITEYEQITSTGRTPLANNLIRRLVKSIIGRYRDMAEKSKWYDSSAQSIDTVCELDELDSRLLEEFLISGMAIQRIADDSPFAPVHPSDFSKSCPDVINVPPPQFFCNDFRDPRGHDIEMIGMLHDMSPAEIRARFGHGNPETIAEIDRLLADNDTVAVPASLSATAFYSAPPGRVRIIETWSRQYDNSGRISWQARWFSASGKVLDSYPSPWAHGSHPFVVKFYPLTDGEVHSFVEDIVDQQHYINRLIQLMDRILATSAKGILLFPVHQKLKDMTWKDIADRWASTDSVLPIAGPSSEAPRQVSSNGGDTNAYRLLEMQLKLFDQTSGVGSALLGGASGAAERVTGIEHYQAQVENATIALADIFSTFRSLIRHRNTKLNSLGR